ncbi:hypothetical protein MJ257_05420, partial [Paenibacillus timonensis]|uniref:hypothetical protein n=1 Tax=Paenibacillus timonensis TaxID=225915 RepID=UPI001F0584EC
RFPLLHHIFFDLEVMLIVAQALLKAGINVAAFFFAAQHEPLAARFTGDSYLDAHEKRHPLLSNFTVCLTADAQIARIRMPYSSMN